MSSSDNSCTTCWALQSSSSAEYAAAVLWVIIFVAIAVAGLIMVVCYAVWLAHKTADVLSEVTVLADRGGQLLELIGQIDMPPARFDPDVARDLATSERTLHPEDIDVR